MADMRGHGLLIRHRDVLLFIPGALLLPPFSRTLQATDGNWPALRRADGGELHYEQRLTTESAAFSASPVAGDGQVYCTGEAGQGRFSLMCG